MAITNEADLTHIARTTEQWENTYDRNVIIPEGVLCIEFTSSGKTNIKIGDGHHIFSRLPYVNGTSEIVDCYTKQETDNRIIQILNNECVVRIKGVLDDVNKLPVHAACGDLWFVIRQNPEQGNKFEEYLYSSEHNWELVGGTPVEIDLSKYATKEYVDGKIRDIESKLHTHDNKSILDQITAAFTKEEKDKLKELYNYDDTELRELIEKSLHNHSNKEVLDSITKYDIEKLRNLDNYDDTLLKKKITALEELAHGHSNKSILDKTTASFTTDYERLMPLIRLYIGATGFEDGAAGLVPPAKAGEQNYVLTGSGKWVPNAGGVYELPIATKTELGGIKIGEGLEISEDGTLTVIGGGTGCDNVGRIDRTEGAAYHGEIFNTYDGPNINKAIGMATHAEGLYTTASGHFSHSEGMSTEATGMFSHAEGNNTDATADSSHAEGELSQANGTHSHAEGFDTRANGKYAHSEGQNTVANYGSHSEGYYTVAGDLDTNKRYAHAEGRETKAIGEASHSEGEHTTASGNWSHAEGYYSEATNNQSHAEGHTTHATGQYSHSEGYGTTASGDSAHAEGFETEASMQGAHAEGQNTHATNYYTHAEGYGNTSSGQAAHSEGYSNEATHDYSHVEGYYNKTGSMYQHIQGKYNVPESDKMMIIGNGTDDANRKNIFTIDKEGNIQIGIINADGDFEQYGLLNGVDVTQLKPTPIATETTVGTVKPGEGLTISEDGTLSVTGGGSGGGTSGDSDNYIEGNGIRFETVEEKILPEGYTQLSYIEGDGSQYTIIDYIPTSITRIVAVASTTDMVSTGKPLFGVRTSSSSGNFVLWAGNESYNGGFLYGDMAWATDLSGTGFNIGTYAPLGTKTKFDCSLDGVYVNNQLAQTPIDKGSPSNWNMGIFAIATNTSGTVETRKYIGKIYSFNVYDNNTQVHQLIPAYSEELSVAGLYDLNTNVFYKSLSGTEFLYDANELTNPPVTTKTSINVKPATETDIGGIIVGDGLSITEDGVLSISGEISDETYRAGLGINIEEKPIPGDIELDILNNEYAGWDNFTYLWTGGAEYEETDYVLHTTRDRVADEEGNWLTHFKIPDGVENIKVEAVAKDGTPLKFWIDNHDSETLYRWSLLGRWYDSGETVIYPDEYVPSLLKYNYISIGLCFDTNNTRTISVDDIDYVKLYFIEGDPENPKGMGKYINSDIASEYQLGGVIIGKGINVTEDGVISVDSMPLEPATSDTLGGIKVGNGLEITKDGKLNVIGGGGTGSDCVTDVDLKQDAPGVIVVTKPNETKELDVFQYMTELEINCIED